MDADRYTVYVKGVDVFGAERHVDVDSHFRVVQSYGMLEAARIRRVAGHAVQLENLLRLIWPADVKEKNGVQPRLHARLRTEQTWLDLRALSHQDRRHKDARRRTNDRGGATRASV